MKLGRWARERKTRPGVEKKLQVKINLTPGFPHSDPFT